MSLTVVGITAGLVLALATALWVVSIFKRDVSIVDPFWSLFFLLIVLSTVAQTGFTAGKLLLVGIVATWAIRLFVYLLLRSIGEPEDVRYQAFRKRFGPERYWWFSFFQVFLLQGALAFIVSAPLQLAGAAGPDDPITVFDLIGTALFVVGFIFEAGGDWQLSRFKKNPENKGKVLNTGLWGLTRHPNYFGNAVMWWGFWLCALDQPFGWATAVGPIVMTYLLVKVSGVAMLDAHLKKTKPGYEEYIRDVPAFIPRLPGRRR